MSEGNQWIMWNLCSSPLKLQNKDLPTSQNMVKYVGKNLGKTD